MSKTFLYEPFDVAEDTPLEDFANTSFIDNADRDNWDVFAANDDVGTDANGERVAGPTTDPDSFNYGCTIFCILGGDTNFHRPGALVRWNGEAYASSSMQAYGLIYRAASQDWAIWRRVAGETLWLTSGSGPTTIGTSEEFGLHLEAETVDASTVRLRAYIRTGDGGFQLLGTTDDTASNRITTIDHIGFYSRRIDTRIRFIQGRYVVTEDDPFVEDTFTEGSDTALENHTADSSHTYAVGDASNGEFQVIAADNALARETGTGNRTAVPTVTPPSADYTTRIVGTLESAISAGNNLLAAVRHDTADMSDGFNYTLELRASDGWRFNRRDDGGGGNTVELLSDLSYMADNSIAADTEVTLELSAETVTTGVVLLVGTITLDGGTPDEVFYYFDTDALAITDANQPGVGTGVDTDTRVTSFEAFQVSETVPTSPFITSVSPATMRDGDEVTINGAFPETIQALTVGGASQTINAQDLENVTFTFSLGDLTHGSQTLTVDDETNDPGSSTVFVAPVAGRTFINVANIPAPDGQETLFKDADPPVTAGMQFEYTSPTDQGDQFDANSDGTGTVHDDENSHQITGRIHDGASWGEDATWTIEPQFSEPPVANAGGNILVQKDTETDLDGSGSSDDVGIVDVQWTQVSGPSVTIFGTNQLNAIYTPTETGIYEFRLTVEDADGNTDSDTVIHAVYETTVTAVGTNTAVRNAVR